MPKPVKGWSARHAIFDTAMGEEWVCIADVQTLYPEDHWTRRLLQTAFDALVREEKFRDVGYGRYQEVFPRPQSIFHPPGERKER